MSPQPTPSSHPAPTEPSLLRPDTRSSTFKQYATRRRRWLIAIALVLVAGMVVGILFAAHDYYRAFGGQGWLSKRNRSCWRSETPTLYLPTRKVEARPNPQFTDWSRWFGWKRSPINPPVYTCGDQQNSCEAYGQPNICCPVTFICYPTSVTPSEIFCCNSTKSAKKCHASKTHPPKCLPFSIECLANVGGGCCPNTTQCSSSGCIQITDLTRTTTSSPSSSDLATVSKSSKISNSRIKPSTNETSVSGGMTRILVSATTLMGTVTTTESIAASVMSPKEGEVPQKGTGTKRPVVLAQFLPYSAAWILVIIAVLMGML